MTLAWLGLTSVAAAGDRLAEEAAEGRWPFTPRRLTVGLQAGGGFSTARGLRDAKVALLVARVGYVLVQQERFLPGSLEVVGEPSYLAAVEGEAAHVLGLTALFKYSFSTGTRIVPFIEGGGGFSYASINVPRTGTNFNFIAQTGAGLHYLIGERSTIDLRGIYHHISNANISEQNPSLNSALFTIGFTFLY